MADYDVKVLEISKGGNTYTYDAGGTHYAVCDTAAGTQTKAVTISEIASLTAGLSVRIKFSNAQTYNGQPKLQINSLTATNIVRMGTTAASQYEWNAGEVLDFVYDGTNFIIQEGAVPTTTYYGGRIKLSSATNSTSEALAATPKAVKAAYDLANGKASTSVATQSANGLMSSTDKTKLDGIATGATANVGTITGITMNGASKGTSGVVNLGTVLTSHQDISSKVDTPRARKYILLGDSYMGLGLGNQIVAQTGITATIFSAGGGGFVGKGGTYTFLTGLQKATENFTTEQKNAVTDIYVLGGYNDYNFASSDIGDAMSTFHQYVVSTFPNATVTLGVIAFSKRDADLAYIEENVIPTYMNYARALCWRFIPYANMPIHYPDAISNDGVHPVSTQGIADYVSQYIMRGNASFTSTLENVAVPYNNTASSGSMTLKTKIENGMCTIYNESLAGFVFNSAFSFTNGLNPNDRTSIFTYDGFARGILLGNPTSGTPSISVNIPILGVWIDNSTFEDCDGILYFAYGYIGLAMKRRTGQLQNAFSTSSFAIPPFSITVPSDLC